MKIKSQKDFWAGLMFITFGLFFLFFARDYRMGSLLRMGPAYFPTILSTLLIVVGGVVFFQSFMLNGGKVPGIFFRPIFCVTLSLLLFGYLFQLLGLVLGLVLLIFVSALGGHEFKVKEVAILTLLLTAFTIVVFAKCLALPFPTWPAFLN